MTAKRVVIVGGGGAGDAAAFGLRKRGFDGDVALLSADSDRPYDRPSLPKKFLMGEAAPVPLARALGDEVGEVYASIHRSRGVDVRTGTTVKEWHLERGRVSGVTLSDSRREAVDLVLVAIGIEPNLDLPRALDL